MTIKTIKEEFSSTNAWLVPCGSPCALYCLHYRNVMCSIYGDVYHYAGGSIWEFIGNVTLDDEAKASVNCVCRAYDGFNNHVEFTLCNNGYAPVAELVKKYHDFLDEWKDWNELIYNDPSAEDCYPEPRWNKATKEIEYW